MFQVLINYGLEGWKFWGPDKGYDSLDQAVREGIANSYGAEFKILEEVEWRVERCGY